MRPEQETRPDCSGLLYIDFSLQRVYEKAFCCRATVSNHLYINCQSTFFLFASLLQLGFLVCYEACFFLKFRVDPRTKSTIYRLSPMRAILMSPGGDSGTRTPKHRQYTYIIWMRAHRNRLYRSGTLDIGINGRV